MSNNPLIPDPDEQAEAILEDLRKHFDISDDIEPEHLVELIDPEKPTWQNVRPVAESLFLVEPEPDPITRKSNSSICPPDTPRL